MATIIFKATEACNARCEYCDVVHKNQSTQVMSTELLELFFYRINEYLSEFLDQNIEIIWHGGEPLLLGIEFYQQAIEFQERLCLNTQSRVRHAIQSNLTLLSSEFIDIFRKLGIKSVGTSYDPICNVRGLGKTRDSNGYNKLFMEGIKLLEKNGLSWGIIYVVTKYSLHTPVDIFYFLTNLSPHGMIMFNPVNIHDSNLQHLVVSPQEFADFLGEIFPIWWKYRDRYSQIEPFYSLYRNVINREQTLFCSDAGDCARTHINVAPDGKISQCGRSSDYGILDYGSLQNKSFQQIFLDPQRADLLNRDNVLSNTECKDCRFWSICHGGCPLDAWSKTGSFFHKSPWCTTKKGYIEKYLEPALRQKQISIESEFKDSSGEHDCSSNRIKYKKNGGLTWIDPIGGLGDTLMISGVLKRFTEVYPDKKFNLVMRTKYSPILKGHPAIFHIGYPPQDARFIRTDYWEQDIFGNPEHRAFQILAKMFDLDTPVDESLFVPWDYEDTSFLTDHIPLQEKNILICPSSDSPRKQMSINKWKDLVDRLKQSEIGVVQVGTRNDEYVQGAYSLLGLTTPRQLISILSYFDTIVTSDNFIMHAAHLRAVPTVVLWGPTDHRIYGYKEQIHIQAKPSCSFSASCIGKGHGHLYATKCSEVDIHCMNIINLTNIEKAIHQMVNMEKFCLKCKS